MLSNLSKNISKKLTLWQQKLTKPTIKSRNWDRKSKHLRKITTVSLLLMK